VIRSIQTEYHSSHSHLRNPTPATVGTSLAAGDDATEATVSAAGFRNYHVTGAPRRGDYGRFRPSRSWAATHSSVITAAPSETSPHNTVAATISASLRTWPAP